MLNSQFSDGFGDLEQWFISFMKTLDRVREENEANNASEYNYSVLFTREEIEKLTNAWRGTEWVEIY